MALSRLARTKELSELEQNNEYWIAIGQTLASISLRSYNKPYVASHILPAVASSQYIAIGSLVRRTERLYNCIMIPRILSLVKQDVDYIVGAY